MEQAQKRRWKFRPCVAVDDKGNRRVFHLWAWTNAPLRMYRVYCEHCGLTKRELQTRVWRMGDFEHRRAAGHWRTHGHWRWVEVPR